MADTFSPAQQQHAPGLERTASSSSSSSAELNMATPKASSSLELPEASVSLDSSHDGANRSPSFSPSHTPVASPAPSQLRNPKDAHTRAAPVPAQPPRTEAPLDPSTYRPFRLPEDASESQAVDRIFEHDLEAQLAFSAAKQLIPAPRQPQRQQPPTTHRHKHAQKEVDADAAYARLQARWSMLDGSDYTKSSGGQDFPFDAYGPAQRIPRSRAARNSGLSPEEDAKAFASLPLYAQQTLARLDAEREGATPPVSEEVYEQQVGRLQQQSAEYRAQLKQKMNLGGNEQLDETHDEIGAQVQSQLPLHQHHHHHHLHQQQQQQHAASTAAGNPNSSSRHPNPSSPAQHYLEPTAAQQTNPAKLSQAQSRGIYEEQEPADDGSSEAILRRMQERYAKFHPGYNLDGPVQQMRYQQMPLAAERQHAPSAHGHQHQHQHQHRDPHHHHHAAAVPHAPSSVYSNSSSASRQNNHSAHCEDCGEPTSDPESGAKRQSAFMSSSSSGSSSSSNIDIIPTLATLHPARAGAFYITTATAPMVPIRRAAEEFLALVEDAVVRASRREPGVDKSVQVDERNTAVDADRARLEQENTALQATIAVLAASNTRLKEEVEALRARAKE